MLTLVLLFIQLLMLGILIWGVCEYIRLRHLLCNINRRMTMDIDGVIDGLLEADDASYHAATKHDTKYQRHAGPEGTHGGDGEATGTATTSQQVVQQHRDRLARLAAGGRARQYIVKALSGRRYGGGGWEALRPLRGSALSSDDKSPGGSCPPAIHICGQHVSTNTPWGAARATIRTGGRPLHWARGQQGYIRDVPLLRHVPCTGDRGANHTAPLPIWTARCSQNSRWYWHAVLSIRWKFSQHQSRRRGWRVWQRLHQFQSWLPWRLRWNTPQKLPHGGPERRPGVRARRAFLQSSAQRKKQSTRDQRLLLWRQRR